MHDTSKVTDWVVDAVEARVSAEPDGNQQAGGNIWTSERRLRNDGAKSTTEFNESEIEAGMDAAIEQRRIIGWHGLLAPTTEEHLRAIVGNENMSETPRKVLIERVQEMLTALDEGDDAGTKDDEAEAAPEAE